jgi:hypothetical protein
VKTIPICYCAHYGHTTKYKNNKQAAALILKARVKTPTTTTLAIVGKSCIYNRLFLKSLNYDPVHPTLKNLMLFCTLLHVKQLINA